MKVALFSYGDLSQRSGGNLYDQHLVRALEALGHEVSILGLRHGTYASCAAIGAGRRGLDAFPDVNWSEFDLIVEDELIHPSMFRGAAALDSVGRIPVVSIVHHLRSSEGRREPLKQDLSAQYFAATKGAGRNTLNGLGPAFSRGIERCYLRRIDAFVFNSETTRHTVEELIQQSTYGVVATPGGDRLLVPGYVDSGYVEARCFEPGPLRIVFVGNMVTRKGLLELVSALSAESRFDWLLEIIGSGEHEPRYAASVRRRVEGDRTLAERVKFLGPLADTELAERLAQAQVLCVPSSWEGFGIVYLEAQAFGLPVLAGCFGAAAEVVTQGETGFLVDSKDPSSVSDALWELASDRGKLHRMAMQSQKNFASYPGWQDSTLRAARFLEGFALGCRARLRKEKHRQRATPRTEQR